MRRMLFAALAIAVPVDAHAQDGTALPDRW